MAYLIGNTTVITNNGALGTVDGNSLNLANNNNLSAGGASFKSVTNTQNSAVVGSTYAYVFLQGGGGGGSYNYYGGYAPSGYAGLTNMTIVDVSAGGNATFTVGAGGTNPNSANPGPATGGNPGGTTSYTHPGYNIFAPAFNSAVGGSKQGTPYAPPTVTSMNPFAALSNVRAQTGIGTPQSGSSVPAGSYRTAFFSPYGDGSNGIKSAGQPGIIKMLGF